MIQEEELKSALLHSSNHERKDRIPSRKEPNSLEERTSTVLSRSQREGLRASHQLELSKELRNSNITVSASDDSSSDSDE